MIGIAQQCQALSILFGEEPMINQEQRPATVNVTIQAKRRIYYGLVSVAILSVVAVLLVLIYLQMSGAMTLPQTAQVQPSPPVTEGQGQA